MTEVKVLTNVIATWNVSDIRSIGAPIIGQTMNGKGLFSIHDITEFKEIRTKSKMF